MPIRDRASLDAALMSADPAGAIRAALADGSLDALVPEIRIEMDIPQRTRYHYLTNLEHSLATMAAMPPVLDERLAGLFHDIGKRRTTTIKPSNGDEQYLGHGPTGARMTRVILERLAYPAPLTERVVRWIFLHMDLHLAANNGWSDKAIAKVLGKVAPDLAVLGRLQIADIDAMNPTIRAEKRAGAIAYQARLREVLGR